MNVITAALLQRHPTSFFFPTATTATLTTMAGNIPAALRTADIGRFAIRATQVERPKPVIAYWCEFVHTAQVYS